MAAIVVPKTPPLIVFADGAVSSKPIKWRIASPVGTKMRVEGTTLIVESPTPGVVYKVVQIVSGDDGENDFAFADIAAGGQVLPPAIDPAKPTIPPVPVAPVADKLGFVALTRQALVATNWSAESQATGRATLAAIFDAQAAASATYPTAQAINDATGKRCKAAIGDAGWPAWKLALKPVLDALARQATASDSAQAYREISAALRETN